MLGVRNSTDREGLYANINQDDGQRFYSEGCLGWTSSLLAPIPSLVSEGEGASHTFTIYIRRIQTHVWASLVVPDSYLGWGWVRHKTMSHN